MRNFSNNNTLTSANLQLTIVLLCLFGSVLISGCFREEQQPSEIVAQVGDRVLTANEVTAWEVSLRQGNVSQEIRWHFIRRWVEEELLYKAALDRGIDNDPWVLQRMDELTRTLLVARMLELEATKVPEPSPQAVRDYFQDHSSEFVWSCDHLVVDYWVSTELGALQRLRANLLRGGNIGIWGGGIGSLDHGKIALDASGSTTEEIWQAVSRLRVGEISQVLTITDDPAQSAQEENHFWVFKLIERYMAGTPQKFEDVSDDIVIRLAEKAHRSIREEMVRNLAEEYFESGRLRLPNQPDDPSQDDVDGSTELDQPDIPDQQIVDTTQ